MLRDFPDVTYIIIGSKEKLSKVKSYQIEEGVECLLCPFSSLDELPSLLDSKIAELESEVISIIPAGAFPKKLAREQLLHFSKSKYQFWGWYHFGNKFKLISIKKNLKTMLSKPSLIFNVSGSSEK